MFFKWCRLQMRKAKILELLKRVQKYVTESGLDEANSLRKITEKDFKEYSCNNFTEFHLIILELWEFKQMKRFLMFMRISNFTMVMR